MAQPKKVAASLRKSGKNIARIPDTAVQAAAEQAVVVASEEGGRFFGGRYPLYAEVKSVRTGKKATALIVGRPAGGWVIKGIGRGPIVPVNRQALKSSSSEHPFPKSGPAGPARSGRGRWSRVVERMNQEFPDIVTKALDNEVNG